MQEETRTWPRHGFVPDPLVENDASPCEMCGGRYRDRVHTGYALFVKEADKEIIQLEATRDRLEADTARYRKALEEIGDTFLGGDTEEAAFMMRAAARTALNPDQESQQQSQ